MSMNPIARAFLFIVVCFSSVSFAQSGFNDDDIVALLRPSAVKARVLVSDIIEAAQERIAPKDMVRFFITVEGELFMLDGNNDLYAMVVLPPLDTQFGKVLPCFTPIAALLKRTDGIERITDDIFGDDALSDRFEFQTPDDFVQALNDLVRDLEEMDPQAAVRRKALKRSKLNKKRSKLKNPFHFPDVNEFIPLLQVWEKE